MSQQRLKTAVFEHPERNMVFVRWRGLMSGAAVARALTTLNDRPAIKDGAWLLNDLRGAVFAVAAAEPKLVAKRTGQFDLWTIDRRMACVVESGLAYGVVRMYLSYARPEAQYQVFTDMADGLRFLDLPPDFADPFAERGAASCGAI